GKWIPWASARGGHRSVRLGGRFPKYRNMPYGRQQKREPPDQWLLLPGSWESDVAEDLPSSTGLALPNRQIIALHLLIVGKQGLSTAPLKDKIALLDRAEAGHRCRVGSSQRRRSLLEVSFNCRDTCDALSCWAAVECIRSVGGGDRGELAVLHAIHPHLV